MEREPNIQSRNPSATRIPARARLDARELAAVFAGGMIGVLPRSVLAQTLSAGPGQWPWATFAVNMAAAFALGAIAAAIARREPLALYRRALLASGVCGALSTFSTLMLELAHMLEQGYAALALAYAAASLAGGLAAVHVASRLIRGAGARA